jgi:hypothetical protein
VVTGTTGTFTNISGNGSSLTAINASNISSGTIDNARTTAASANGASTIVARDAGGNFAAATITATTFSGAHSGNGAGLTDINASNISSGTIANARTTAATANGASTIVLRGTSGEFSAGAITSVSISGNGVALTAINASNVTSGTLDNASTSADSANGASTIVARDTSGNFTANAITTTTISGNGVGLTAINASNIASGTLDNARTTAASANGASTIVLRGASGEFSAGIITANGSAISAINGSNVTTGTVANARTTASAANSASTIVTRDSTGSFATNIITFGAGANTAPSITTAGDTNTGIYFPAADTIAFTEGGVEAGRFTSTGALQLNGNLTFSGTGNRITGDFSNATVSNRVIFQTSTTNGNTGVYAIPNGTSPASGWAAFNSNSLTNVSFGNFAIDSTAVFVESGRFGSGTFLPMAFLTSGAERMRIASDGKVGIGTNNPGELLDVVGSPTGGGTCIRTNSGSSGSNGGQITLNNTFSGTPNPAKHFRVNNSGELEIVNSGYTAVIFALTNGGSAFNATGTWGTLSDARVKDNVETARDYLSDLCRLRVVKYSLKSEKSQVPTKLGFVAQEVEQVFPNMVEESLDTFGDLGNIKQIKLSVLTPMLVKAIQELKATVDAQAAEIAALKLP